MSDRPRDDTRDAAASVGELARTVEELQGELAGTSPRRGLPTPRALARFTSEVTIPAIVLALETNVRALKLLQRALRLAAGEGPATGGRGGEARQRAEELGRETLARLDDALADLQEALAERPPEDPARELLAEARRLRADIDDRLATDGPGEDTVAGADQSGPRDRGVDIDVESELQSIKDDLDNGEDDTGGSDEDH
ncbi:MAG: hypothetical protein BRD23_06825 [Halobacteriales archaeon SW_9_67_25]|jgi:hypothetical protein|nr:MAG: hypothetical protein BRD23_06825 [Halobacteriales archaeon SW_9_67_25]